MIHGNRTLFTCASFKILAIYNKKYAINLSNFWLCTLNPCVFTKFGFIAHMILLIAHVILLIVHKIASLVATSMLTLHEH